MKRLIRRLVRQRAEPAPQDEPEVERYDQDGLCTIHNHEFMREPGFVRAYQRGVQAAGEDYGWHWRVHIGLWAADCARALPGDFVECGVNRGFLSSAIMEYLDWDSLDRTFYLLDTFGGLDERFVSEAEVRAGSLEKNREFLESGLYVSDVESVRANFAQWTNLQIIAGTIPDTLEQVDSERVAYLHVDLNCSPPEVAALEFFWERLVPGALVLLDDYAFHGYRPQKLGMDTFAAAHGVKVASLPTGQGLLVKPA